jgi:hypothetical protein
MYGSRVVQASQYNMVAVIVALKVDASDDAVARRIVAGEVEALSISLHCQPVDEEVAGVHLVRGDIVEGGAKYLLSKHKVNIHIVFFFFFFF